MSNQAIVFLTDSKFLPGFKVFYKSLLSHNQHLLNEVDKILIVDSSVEVDDLDESLTIMRVNESDYDSLKLDVRFPFWHKTFHKLEIFDLDQYERVVFLESDLLCTGDISYLFRLETEAEILGVLHTNKIWISPGVLVLNKKILKKKLKKQLIQIASDVSYDGDSPLINNFILDSNNAIEREFLPFEYNFVLSFDNHWKETNLEDIRIVHYAGVAKPWFNSRLAEFYTEYAKHM